MLITNQSNQANDGARFCRVGSERECWPRIQPLPPALGLDRLLQARLREAILECRKQQIVVPCFSSPSRGQFSTREALCLHVPFFRSPMSQPILNEAVYLFCVVCSLRLFIFVLFNGKTSSISKRPISLTQDPRSDDGSESGSPENHVRMACM